MDAVFGTVGQVGQGYHIDLHHRLVVGKVALMEFAMTAKTCVVDQNVDLDAGRFRS